MKPYISKYKKNPIYESYLKEFNKIISPIQDQISKNLREPKRTTIFLLGTPRCGHTLLGQLMIERFRLAYPSNFIARFWKAPGIGARIQSLILSNFDEIDHRDTNKYKSEHGSTKGLKGLHEFSYFWNDFLNFEDTHSLTKEELKKINKKKILRYIASLEHELGNIPVLFKNGQLGFQASFFAKILPKSVFIYCRRNSLYTAQSIVLMREKRLGDRNVWFGFRPPEYTYLKDKPWAEQIAGQIIYIHKHLKSQFELIEKGRTLFLNYEDICDNPKKEINKIVKLIENQGENLEVIGDVPDGFECQNINKLPEKELDLLKEKLNQTEKEVQNE